MIEINRETFEAWLFSQPEGRAFKYDEGHPNMKTGCLLCSFFKETRRASVLVYGKELGPDDIDGERTPIPNWARKLTHINPLTIAAVQRAYIADFGDPRLHLIYAQLNQRRPLTLRNAPLETNSGEVAEAGPVNFR